MIYLRPVKHRRELAGLMDPSVLSGLASWYLVLYKGCSAPALGLWWSRAQLMTQPQSQGSGSGSMR